jgi:hypothetical protein
VIDGINRRAANIRAGHVYVISNVGAFGPNMIKVGMTRRLEPLDRVRGLGDASVPFHYDVHAMVFSDDAVSLETSLHHQLAHHRVNPRQSAPRVLPRDPRGGTRPPSRAPGINHPLDRRTRSSRMAPKRNDATPANATLGAA